MGEESGTGDAYVCEACGKEFATEQELRAHVTDVGLVD